MRYALSNDLASLGLRLVETGIRPRGPSPLPEVQSGFRPVGAPEAPPTTGELLRQGRFRPFDPFRARTREYRWRPTEEEPTVPPIPATEGGFMPIQAPRPIPTLPNFPSIGPGFETSSFAAPSMPVTALQGPQNVAGGAFFGNRAIWG